MTNDVCSRTAWTVSRNAAASRLGLCSASRMWMWIREAPAAWQATAVSTSSANVVGSWGQSPLPVSAPVGATVIRVPAARTVACLIQVASLVMPDILSAGGCGRDVYGAQGLYPCHPETVAGHCGSHAGGSGGSRVGGHSHTQGLRGDHPALRLDVRQHRK